MAKILAKIKRRKNTNELPDRRELVEMDLFDTDRNPWPGQLGGGGLWQRYDYDPVVPFIASLDANGVDQQAAGPVDLVVDRPSLAVAFVGGEFGVAHSGDGKSVTLKLEASGPAGELMAYTEQTFITDGSGYVTHDYDAYTFVVLNPGTYSVKFWVWTSNPTSDPNNPVVTFSKLAATIALIPAGLASLGSGWGGTPG